MLSLFRESIVTTRLQGHEHTFCSSSLVLCMNVQAVDLHISDDQRPLAGPQTDIQPMDTAEVHHQPPRGEDDPEVAGMPMDAAGNDDFQRYGETHQ